MRGMFELVTLSVLGIVTSVAGASTFNSNGTGGGNWTSTDTWISGVPTTGSFTVKTGDTVTASNVTLDCGSSTNPQIYGTLNLNNGSSFTGFNRINYSGTTDGGVINLNGSTLTGTYLYSQTHPLTVNVNSGGVLNTPVAASSNTTVNVNTGGTFNVIGTAGTINLNGGTMVDTDGATNQFPVTSWTGGTYVVNTATQSSATITNLSARLASNANNVLDLSNKSTKQTYTTNNSIVKLTGGIVRLHVYSATDDDSDQFNYVTLGAFDFSSNVTLQFNDQGPLPGTATDYVGKSYKLFTPSKASYYSLILPTLAATQWNIGGNEYNVTFTNTLSTDGMLTVNSLSAVPEPAALALLGLAGALALRRRRPRA